MPQQAADRLRAQTFPQIALAILALTVADWGTTLDASALAQGFMFWRKQGVLLTGLWAIVLMSVLLFMATRPRWLEQRLGGLDHLYHQHKWCGISAGSAVLLHWALEKSPKWLSSLGLLTLGKRPPHGGTDILRGIATEAGELAFYALVLLLVASLVRALPYGRFRQIHKIGAILFIAAAFHSVWLIPDSQRWNPYGLLTLVAAIGGSLAALWLLAGRAGRAQRSQGTITALHQHPDGVLELAITLQQGLPHYQPGQFALLTLHPDEGSHPFTILHYDPASRVARFAIKALGDYTRSLPEQLQPGAPAVIEGPYGRFALPGKTRPELWIAGGIGIAPFIAWLEALAEQGQTRNQARLYYCIRHTENIPFSERLAELCQRAGVALTLVISSRNGRLNPEDLPVTTDTHVWFCGPEKMRDMLKQRLALPAGQMHYELFEFR